jgi:hypothetical protein
MAPLPAARQLLALLLAAAGVAGAAGAAAAPPPLATRLPFPLPPTAERLLVLLEAWARANQTEAAVAALVLLALLNLAYGAWQNSRRFAAISDALFRPEGGAFMSRQFAGHGHARSPNPTLWWRESLNHAVLWASGRRNLDGCLVAVEIKPRQDLLYALGLVQLAAGLSGGAALEPREGDVLLPGSREGVLLDAFVAEGAMPWKGVLALGTRSCLRALAKKFPVDVGDLAQAHAIDPSASGGGGGGGLPYAWPSPDLAVQTDQPALFQALFASPKVAAILADPAQAQLVRRHLRAVYVTSSFQGRNARRVIAEVKLPAAASRARDVEPALELVMAMVDALPGFRQSAEALKRAEEARAAANAAHEARRARRDEQQSGGGGRAGRGKRNLEHEATQRRMIELRQKRLAEEREKARRDGKLEEWERQQRLKEQRKLAKKRSVRM